MVERFLRENLFSMRHAFCALCVSYFKPPILVYRGPENRWQVSKAWRRFFYLVKAAGDEPS
jgi:hypothetical protein